MNTEKLPVQPYQPDPKLLQEYFALLARKKINEATNEQTSISGILRRQS